MCQGVHSEALQMRDATKVVLLRHEHSANAMSKSRQRQAQDFRRQVEERKVELERLERKLFASSKETKNNLFPVNGANYKLQVKPLLDRAVLIHYLENQTMQIKCTMAICLVRVVRTLPVNWRKDSKC